jgi:hypothetical protein
MSTHSIQYVTPKVEEIQEIPRQKEGKETNPDKEKEQKDDNEEWSVGCMHHTQSYGRSDRLSNVCSGTPCGEEDEKGQIGKKGWW